MKTISLSLLAIAAFATAASAGSNRSNDLRDSPTYSGRYAVSAANTSAITEVHAIAVADPAGGSTNFDMMKKTSDDNDHGRH